MICPGCDGDGSLSMQWAKEEMVRTGGRLILGNNGDREFHYYVRGDNTIIENKTIGGPCRICKGEKVIISRWMPTTDPVMLRRIGKLSEELGELQSVAARCIIQGIDEIDPGTNRVNRDRLEDEIADVQAQLNCTVIMLNLSSAKISKRSGEKMMQMVEWEKKCEEVPDGQGK